MVSNRIFIALFGLALLGSAAYHLTQSPRNLGGVVFATIGGLFLLNIAVRVGRLGLRWGNGACLGRPAQGHSGDVTAAQG